MMHKFGRDEPRKMDKANALFIQMFTGKETAEIEKERNCYVASDVELLAARPYISKARESVRMA
jgi:hypothetical protein